MSRKSFLEGQILIAMPGMGDPRFDRSVIYLCAHSDDGALGFVVNKDIENVDFSDLLEQLEVPHDEIRFKPSVQFGGPVETERGFVLHSTDYQQPETSLMHEGTSIGVTATLDILKAIAKGQGPNQSILVLGYAGWAPGQLEEEIHSNGWLHCEGDPALVFNSDNESKWEKALEKLGVDASFLSSDAGRA